MTHSDRLMLCYRLILIAIGVGVNLAGAAIFVAGTLALGWW